MILGLDIGTYSVKAVLLDPKKRNQLVLFAEEQIPRKIEDTPQPDAADQAPAPSPSAQAQAGDDTTPGGDWEEVPDADDAPTNEVGAATEDGDGPTEFGDDFVGEAQAEPDLGPSLEGWQAATMTLLGRLERDGEGAMTALPHGKAVTVQVSVPFDNASKVEQILPGLLDDKLPMSLARIIYTFKLQSHGDEHEAMIGFAQRHDMQEFLDDLDAVGVNPASVTVPEYALRYVARAYIPNFSTETFALIDMGHTSTRVLVCQEGHVVLARSMTEGSEDVTEAIAEAFEADFTEAERVKHAQAAILADTASQAPPARVALSEAIVEALSPMMRDLRRTFQSLYARDRVELEAIYVTGGGSRITNLTEWLTNEFGGVPVQRLSLRDQVETESPLGDDAFIRMPMALSLALQRAHDRNEEHALNLRQDGFAYRGRSSYLRSQLIKLGVAAAVLLVLLGVAMIAQWRDLAAQRDAMRQAVEAETKKVFGQPIWRAKEIKSRATTDSADGEGGFVPKMSAYEVLYELSAKLNGDRELELRRIEVDSDRNLIQVYGTTTTPQEVDRIVSDMEQLECLKSIRKDKLQVRSDEEVNFELQIASECS